MSVEENKRPVETLCKTVFQNHDFSKLKEIMRDDYIQHNQACPQGKAGFIEFFEDIFRGVPDFSYTVKRIISEGDIVMLYATTTGTHDHEWLGNPPTGNELSYDVVDIFRIEDGKIAEHWDVADTMRMAMQLGRVK